MAFARKFFIDVRDLGARGDGVKDDTTPIRRAIAVAEGRGGGVVYFPTGNYLISGTLYVPSFVTLMGDGPAARSSEWSLDPAAGGSRIVASGATTFNLIENSDPTNGNTAIALIGLRFQPGSGTTADVVSVLFSKVRRSLIKGCSFLGGSTTTRVGFRHTGISEGNTVSGCWFEGVGIRSMGSSNRLAVINDTEIANGSIVLSGGYSHIVKGCVVYQDGVSPAQDPYPTPHGIHLDTCIEAQILANNVTAARQHGIYVDGKNNVVKANVVKDCSQQTTGVWSGIALDSNSTISTGNQIEGNRCYDQQGVKTQQHGIAVTSGNGAGNTASNSITGNTVTENRSTTTINLAANLGANTVGNNTGFGDGSATYDPGSLADGAGVTTTVTVTGAALGDYAEASFSNDLQGITLTAWVSAANTVSVRFQNESGGVLDLASGTLRAKVRR